MLSWELFSNVSFYYILQYSQPMRTQIKQQLKGQGELQGREYQLNCFTMEQPLYCSCSAGWLMILDNAQHIYKLNLFSPQGQGEESLHMDDEDLENQNLATLLDGQGDKDIEVGLRMDAGMRVAKCLSCQLQPSGVEMLGALGAEGHLKLWTKQPNQPQYTLIEPKLADKPGIALDFCLNGPASKCPSISLLELVDNQLFKVRKLYPEQLQSGTMTLQEKTPAQTVKAPESLTKFPAGKLVDRSRCILSHDKLLGIHEQFVLQLPLGESKSGIKHSEFGDKLIVYGDESSVWLHSRKSDQSHCVLKDTQVVGVKLVESAGWFACMTAQPVQLHLFSLTGQPLWTVDLKQISSPLMAEQLDSRQFSIQVLDREKIRLHMITKECLMSCLPPMPSAGEESKIHESTATTLKHRLQILKTLQAYAQNHDHNSIFRYLQNCGNNGILNDGLLFLQHRTPSPCPPAYEKQIIELANTLLQDSKYQSHIETALELLLDSCKLLKSGGRHKEWQDASRALQEVVGSKKVKKLQQQNKNKRIFELCYELVHTANSQLPL